MADEEVDRLGRRGVGIGVVGECRGEHGDAVAERAGGEQRGGAADALQAAGSSVCRSAAVAVGAVVVMVWCLSLVCWIGGETRSGGIGVGRGVGVRRRRRSSR